MPASGISSELSAHQMAPAGAIAHSRSHLCPRASTFLFSSLVSSLRPLGLGLLGRCDPRTLLLLGRCDPRTLIFLRRYGRRSGQPSSSSLARRACVHVLPFSLPYGVTIRVFVFFKFVYRDTLKLASAPGPFGGRGEMAMAVASSARLAFLRGAVCACCTQYTRCCSFGPCTDAVHGAPGHKRWGVVETPLPGKTQGGTMNCLLNFVHRVLL